MNTRIFAPGVIETYKQPLRVRVRNAVLVITFIAAACAFGAASAWLLAGLL